MATAFRLLADRIPAEEGPTLAGTLTIERIAELSGRPEAPKSRTVTFLFTVDEAQRFQIGTLFVLLLSS